MSTSADQVPTEAGWSRPCWESLARKSLLVGWWDGWHAAAAVLPPSTVRGIAVAHVFENVCPTLDGSMTIAESIRHEEWVTLLAAETIHAKKYAARHINGAIAARRQGHGMTPPQQANAMKGWSRNLELAIPPRCWCYWRSWLGDLHPSGVLRDATRELWRQPYAGMPDLVLDQTNPEGRLQGELEGEPVRRNVLTGDVQGHRDLADLVGGRGWASVRALLVPLAAEAEARHRSYLAEYGVEQRDLFA